MLWSTVKTTHAHKIDQCELLYYVLRKKYKEPRKMMPGSYAFPEQGASSLKRLSDNPGGCTFV